MNTLKSNICFRNINLTGAFLALAAQNSGLKVTIVLPPTLNWDYEPEITPYYPISFNQFWNSYTNIRFIENISSLFPNLVYPVRIFTFNSTKKINAKQVISLLKNLISFFYKKQTSSFARTRYNFDT